MTTVHTAVMGRRPSANPKGTHLGVRIDAALSDALDREIERETKGRPGFSLNRSDIARMLMAEALVARAKKRR
jgi:hypothetical protein